jgi:phosphate starvation-inducible PhoH-like protein
MIKKPLPSATTRKPRVKKATTNVAEEKKPSLDLLSQIRIDIKHKNETQKKLTQAIKQNDVTICTGSAGTGKTLLSVSEALLLLKNKSDVYHEIKLVKSITELKGESIGTLPGDANEKMLHIMMSYLDAFYKLIGEELTTKLIEAGYIKMEVFAAIRGRSFSNCIILVDEFQNITHDNAKTLLTRFSDNTKLVILGDTGQIDIRNKTESSLDRLANNVNANPIDGVSVINFTDKDIVRHRLTSYFIGLFSDNQTKTTKPKLLLENKIEETPKDKEETNLLVKRFSFFR